MCPELTVTISSSILEKLFECDCEETEANDTNGFKIKR